MRRRYLLSYDVSDKRRLRAVHKIAKAFGSAVQYSVFLCVLTRADRVRLSTEIEATIDHRRDRVIIIDLGLNQDDSWLPEFQTIGRQEIVKSRRHVVV